MMGFQLRQAGQLRRTIRCALLAMGAGLSTAHAADALNGKSLYLNGPVSGGTSCATCHGPSPADNVSGILRAANNPGVISAAFSANRGGMGTLFNGKFTAAELGDLAAFIGNPAVVAAPVANLAPASLNFGGVTLGQSAAALSATLSNSGSAPLNIAAISLGGAAAADFSVAGGSCTAGAAVASGANCDVLLSFRPSAAGTRNGALTIAHNATGGTSTVSLSGTGNALPQATVGLSATSVNFGALIINTASPLQTVTVSNGGSAPLSFTGITLGGAGSAFVTVGGSCATQTPVPVGASCTLTVQATPTVAGPFAASLTLASNASNASVTIGLSGSGAAPAPAVSASPSALAFGAHTIGSGAKTQNVTLTNSGNVALGFTSFALAGAGSIALGAPNGCGATLAVGASCAVPLVYTPTAAGAAAATLTVLSNAAQLQVPVSASATAAPVAVPQLSENGPLLFADTQVGKTSAARTIGLANSGTAALKIATLVLGGAPPGDFVLAGSCAVNGSLSPAASCTIATSFKPGAAGARSADLVLVTDGGTQLTLQLSGNGVAVVGTGVLSVTPQSFDFGAVVIGAASPSRRFALSNSGTAPLVLSSAAFSGPFAKVADASGCAAFPLTLAPGASCELVVGYTPVSAGANNGSVVLQDGAGASLTIALAGQAGVAVPATPAPVQNQGGGGCSASRDGKDPMLAFLALLSIGVIGWRRRAAKGEPQ